jgi:hypothetical protein
LLSAAKAIEACWDEEQRYFFFQLTEFGKQFESQVTIKKGDDK